MSSSRINATTKPELQAMLALFGRGREQRAPKSQVVAAVNLVKADICAGTIEVQRPSDDVMTTDEQRNSEAAKNVSHSLREASLNTWVMKPLLATAGMKKGSRNELEIIKALPYFFANHPGAYRRGLGSSIY